MSIHILRFRWAVFGFLIFVCVLPLKVNAQNFAYPIEKAILEGLSTSPDLSGVYNAQRAAGERIQQQRSRYLPSLDLSASGGYASTDTPIIDDQELIQNQVSLTLSQRLFDGFETPSLLRGSKNEYEASRFRTVEATNLVIVNIINSYLNVLRNRKLLDTARENLKVHEEFFARIKQGADAGRFNLGDLGQVEARLALAKANLESAQLSLDQSIADYIQNIGLEPAGEFVLPEFKSEKLNLSLVDFVAYAKKVSPTIASFDSDLKAAENNISAIRSDFYPDVSLEVTGSAGNDLGGIEGDEDLASALLVMRWNLFSGGLDSAEVKESKFLRAASRDNKIAATRTLELDIRNTWAFRNSSQRQIDEFDKQINANIELVRIYNEQFGIGRRTLLDVLDTQNSLFIARNNYINAVLNTLFSNYQLMALSGDLAEYFNVNDASSIIIDPETETILKPQGELDLRFEEDIQPLKTDYGIDRAQKENQQRKNDIIERIANAPPLSIIQGETFKVQPSLPDRNSKKAFQNQPAKLNLSLINQKYDLADPEYIIEIAEFETREDALIYLNRIHNQDLDILKDLVVNLNTVHSDRQDKVVLETEKMTNNQKEQICSALQKHNFITSCPDENIRVE